MLDIATSFKETLKDFENAGWYVDYTELIAFVDLRYTPKHSRIIASKVFMPNAEKVSLTYSVSTRYKINARGLQFLKVLKNILESYEVEVFWAEPNKVDFTLNVISDFSDQYGEDDESLTDVLKNMWRDSVGVPYSCVLILNVCSRTATRGGTEGYRKLTPSRLAQLCLCDFLRTQASTYYDA